MKKSLCAFSSNFRPLYIGDIYKVLSMPNGYIVHFRYKEKYVDSDIIQNPNKYVNNDITIFFTDIDKAKETANNYSVRKARVTKIEIDKNTDLIHIYMSLENFVDTTLSTDVTEDLLPANKYLIPLKIEKQETSNWSKKIESLNDFFPDLSFFYLQSLTNKYGDVIDLNQRKDKKRSYYQLTQGSDYLFNISLGNPNNTGSTINIVSSSSDLSLNCETPLSITVKFDNLIIPIHLKSLNVSYENSFLTFGPLLGDNKNAKHIKEYQSNLEIQKSLGVFNAIKFGFASLIAVLSIWTIKDHSKSIWNINKNFDFDFVLIIFAFTLLVSISYLFHKFNKK
jgi:hypothetical protein